MVDAIPPEMAGIDPFDLLEREARRIADFYAGLDAAGWTAPTRCAEWNRQELLAHLTSIEDYTRAGLDSTLGDLVARSAAGDVDEWNAWGVEQRADRSRRALLAEWAATAAENRRRLRERGPEAPLDTAVGDYPIGRQAFYLASELAIHADDADVPIADDERETRRDWRVRFARVAVAEAGHGVSIEIRDGGQLVRLGDDEAFLDDETLVETVSGRLPAGRLPSGLHKALVALA